MFAGRHVSCAETLAKPPPPPPPPCAQIAGPRVDWSCLPTGEEGTRGDAAEAKHTRADLEKRKS